MRWNDGVHGGRRGYVQDDGVVKEGARHRCVGHGHSLVRMCSRNLSMCSNRHGGILTAQVAGLREVHYSPLNDMCFLGS